MTNETDYYGDAIHAGVEVMRDQRVKGIKRYGVSIEMAPLSIEQLIRHAQEEMADGLVYTTQLNVSLRRRLEDERANIVAEVLRILDTGANMDIKCAQISALAKDVPNWRTMYVQPSVLEDYWRTGSNLLTLHRNATFPFTKAVLVRA